MSLSARLVYDGGEAVYIPSEMGMPRDNQMQGTHAEQLCELAGRVCYDSLGKGRSSEEYHRHILEVNHTSTLEHFNFTVEFTNSSKSNDCDGVSLGCLNRKGVYLEKKKGSFGEKRLVTLNLRSLLEWKKYTNEHNSITEEHSDRIFKTLSYFGNQIAPRIIQFDYDFEPKNSRLKINEFSENQNFISMFICGSRGFSHEMVRHRYAMSQRSTRYVDESESEWINHPLIVQYMNDYRQSGTEQMGNINRIRSSIDNCRDTYEFLVNDLNEFLIEKNIDKFTARKQARGAARGYLGNALATEMIFTAPVSGWKDMLRQRCTAVADSEIRMIFNLILTELQRSRYGYFFSKMYLIPSPDGIGQVLKEEE